MPLVCPSKFLVSAGFFRYGLPELFMCNLEVNEASIALFNCAVMQLQRDLEDQRTEGRMSARILSATQFTPISIVGKTPNSEGQLTQAILRGAVRKLQETEERLLLAELIETGSSQCGIDIELVAGMVSVGFSVLEMADEQNFLPGQASYDYRRTSKINTVTVLH